MTDRAPIEIRTARVKHVDYEERIIELIAVPYNEWATVKVAGRMVEESFAPGAFGAVDERLEKRGMRVNLEHVKADWVGKVHRLYPNEEGGLRAELKIRRNDAKFDQVLDDAADGMYAASVGFAAEPAGQDWDARRTRRTITRAWLDHIALTGEPAFPNTQVLAVRSTVEPVSLTPNLDRILAERAAQAYHPG